MSLSKHIAENKLKQLVEVEDLAGIGVDELEGLLREEKGLAGFLPETRYAVDPRDQTMVVYNAARAKRPHDTVKTVEKAEEGHDVCPICDGNTTRIVDLAPLSKGFTFVNKNMFPAVYPHLGVEGVPDSAFGLHLLQWTSSYHGVDWHNIDPEDGAVVWERLGVVERMLLSKGEGYISVIKNYGRAVGGSLSHGHQQIVFTKAPAKRELDHQRFYAENRQAFADYVLRTKEQHQVIEESDDVLVVVPSFMRRPYQMLIVSKAGSEHWYELSRKQREGLSRAMQKATAAVLRILTGIGRPQAYNAHFFAGRESGVYVELLPFSQDMGGYEHYGLWVCQQSCEGAREEITESLGYV
jgi:galactose-1-phosphate uridylyltransferase